VKSPIAEWNSKNEFFQGRLLKRANLQTIRTTNDSLDKRATPSGEDNQPAADQHFWREDTFLCLTASFIAELFGIALSSGKDYERKLKF